MSTRHLSPAGSKSSKNSLTDQVSEQHESSSQPASIVNIEKWKLLPEFLKVRGLVKQHIDSYNYFVDVEMKNIVLADAKWTSDVDKRYSVEYTDVSIGVPTVRLENTTFHVTPHMCRLRDLTYAAPIEVTLKYPSPDDRGKIALIKKLTIGYIPVMLHSSICVLSGASEAQLARFQECPHDPGGYFVVKGTEKVILIQEQLSKNRIIIEDDFRGFASASVTSSTHERKSRTAIVLNGHNVYLKHNSFAENIPIVIALKAMGVTSDQEFVSMVGSTPATRMSLSMSVKECQDKNIRTQEEALDWIGARAKMSGSGPLGHLTRPSAEVKTEHFLVSQAKSLSGIPLSTSKISTTSSTSTTTVSSQHEKNPKEGDVFYYRTRADEARDMLAELVLGHIPTKNFDFREKASFLCYMVRRCLDAQDNKKLLDDRDYYGNKRLELAGQLMSLLFEDLFKRFNAELKRNADIMLAKQNKTQAFDLLRYIREDTISNGFNQAISTGNWNVKRFRMERSGVTQQLTRLSYMSAIGHMTRITSQFEKTRKVSGPRSLQPSQWGMLCPSDTPEGEACGLVKNLSLLTHVTTDQDPQAIAELCLNGLGVSYIKAASAEDMFSKNAFMVLLNGLLLGVHLNPWKLAKDLRRLRREGRLGEFVSIFVDDTKKYVLIASDEGRVCRPLIIVENGRSKLGLNDLNQLGKTKLFKSLLDEGLIEYVDVNESNNTMVALRETDITKNTTHLEIDPLTILGVVAGLIPYPHHNQSPRNTYQCAMGKQAIGTIGLNQYNRIETLLYLMSYPQKPLITTRTLDLVKFDNVPGGQNAIVAVMSYSGYDIEDATILNKAALDRGYGRCMVLKKFATSLRNYPNQTRDRIAPPGLRKPISKRLDAVESDGIVGVDLRITPGSILVNREMPTNTTLSMDDPGVLNEYRPSPLSYKGPMGCKVSVDKVMVTSNDHESYIIKVLIRDVRRPELGDKFSSRHGQKGVCGLIVNQSDLPFNRDGVCPDMIMNPHGFPSRMTVGKTIEFIAGKASVHDGKRRYGTAFAGDSIESCSAELIRQGYSYSGRDLLTSGITGEPESAYVFMGPVFYQKLKHMVMDKLHARARGPRAVLTRQPTEGRSRDGGLRLGEMERDCLIGYGTGSLLLERLMISSDQFTATVCAKCGMISRPDWCHTCQTNITLTTLEIPYACKLLFQELTSMNINSRIIMEDR